MNEVRMKAITESQSSIAKKVLSAIPLNEPWTAKQVYAELGRMTGSMTDRRIVDGCINTLVESGLVKESPRGSFRRIEAKPEKEQPTPEVKLVVQPKFKLVEQGATPRDPLDRMAAVAASIRGIGRQLEAAATEVEETALYMQQSIESTATKSEQLDALRKLLKDL